MLLVCTLCCFVPMLCFEWFLWVCVLYLCDSGDFVIMILIFHLFGGFYYYLM